MANPTQLRQTATPKTLNRKTSSFSITQGNGGSTTKPTTKDTSTTINKMNDDSSPAIQPPLLVTESWTEEVLDTLLNDLENAGLSRDAFLARIQLFDFILELGEVSGLSNQEVAQWAERAKKIFETGTQAEKDIWLSSETRFSETQNALNEPTQNTQIRQYARNIAQKMGSDPTQRNTQLLRESEVIGGAAHTAYWSEATMQALEHANDVFAMRQTLDSGLERQQDNQHFLQMLTSEQKINDERTV